MNQRWQPRNGCDGRCTVKSLYETILYIRKHELGRIIELDPSKYFRSGATSNFNLQYCDLCTITTFCHKYISYLDALQVVWWCTRNGGKRQSYSNLASVEALYSFKAPVKVPESCQAKVIPAEPE